jgi:hypothetical protein
MIVNCERAVNFILDGGWQKEVDELVERSLNQRTLGYS